MKIPRIFVAFIILTLTSCRAHMVTVTLVNTSAAPISTIVVDYPSATFGKDRLAPAESFSSPVKITDGGAIKVQFTDARGTSHRYTGPVLHPGEEGSIEIRLDQATAAITVHSGTR